MRVRIRIIGGILLLVMHKKHLLTSKIFSFTLFGDGNDDINESKLPVTLPSSSSLFSANNVMCNLYDLGDIEE